MLNVGCSREAKSNAYKAIIRPILEYACIIWPPHTTKDITTLEAIQSRAARWACNSQNTSSWSLPSHDCLFMLHWPSQQT